MKLLKLYFDHLKMFENGIFEMDLFAEDKVPFSDESAHLLGKSIYSNNVIAFAGINASGKSTALNLIDLACRILDGAPLNQAGLPAQLPGVFDGGSAFRCAFHHDKGIYLIESRVELRGSAHFRESEGLGLRFAEETLSFIPISSFKKAMLSDWTSLRDASKPIMHRSALPDSWKALVSEDTSIAAPGLAMRCGKRVDIPLLWDDGAPRYIDVDSQTLTDIVRVFDQRIEHLEVADAGRVFALKFRGRDVELLSREGLGELLSSGTQRGLALIQRAVAALNRGGYLLVDELENHLNRQLVNVVLQLFTQKATNPKGATVVFTTHYPQLLDIVHRKDNVYFLARGESGGMTPVKYSDKVKRIENKKSEVFISNFIQGTAPRYADVDKLRHIVLEAVANG